MSEKRFTSGRNLCGCHPETCCCKDFAVWDGASGGRHSTYPTEDAAEQAAQALNDALEVDGLRAALATATQERNALQAQKERMAPVQGFSGGIPWSLHLEAYDVYRKKYGPQQALIEGWCRGGFGTSELDEFIPGWRERVSEIGRLKAENAEAKAQCDALAAQLEQHAADTARLDWLDSNLFNRENLDIFGKLDAKYNMWVMFAPIGAQGSARIILDAAREGDQA